jgi:flagellar biosynthetic protein FliQ
MAASEALELCRQALYVGMLVSAPVLLGGMAIALVVGLLQAITQVQDQTVSFVPKIVVMALITGFTLSWILQQLLHFASNVISGIPGRL